jgi:hypothetical protein
MSDSLLTTVGKIISAGRFSLENEKKLQIELEQKLTENGISFLREHHLDKKNIPDFFISGLAIEIKIKGNAVKIYKQLERYASFPEVKEVLLITNRSMGLPTEINGKPSYMIRLGRAWL